MKRVFLLIYIIIFLSGCFYSKEARQFINDKQVQDEIESLIIERGKEDFGLPLEPNMKKMKFGRSLDPPFRSTDKKVDVPVKTIGEPEFNFTVSVGIYDREEDQYRVSYDSIGLIGLNEIGRFLLKPVFKSLHKEALTNLEDFGEGITIKEINLTAAFDQQFDEKDKKEMLKKALADDYKEGKFQDPTQFKYLIDKHMKQKMKSAMEGRECEPNISLEVVPPSNESVSSTEKLHEIVQYIESSSNLPKGHYSMAMDSEKDWFDELIGSYDKRIYEHAFICD